MSGAGFPPAIRRPPDGSGRAGRFVPDYIYNIGTAVLNGGVSMGIFFVVNKIIFPAEIPEAAP